MAGKDVAVVRNNVPERVGGDGTLLMEDARIVFRNFAGAEGMYNREGDRNFCVLLEEDLARDMLDDGWNIKRLKPRDGEELGTAYIQVAVGFKGRPPRMVMITSKGRLDLGEDDCILFDWADILVCDLIIRPYHWNVSGKSGVKAYLKSIFITINEDFLELKYADVPVAELETTDPKAIEGVGSALQAAACADQEAMPDEDGVYDVELVD